jgi:hypothetical protein
MIRVGFKKCSEVPPMHCLNNTTKFDVLSKVSSLRVKKVSVRYNEWNFQLQLSSFINVYGQKIFPWIPDVFIWIYYLYSIDLYLCKLVHDEDNFELWHWVTYSRVFLFLKCCHGSFGISYTVGSMCIYNCCVIGWPTGGESLSIFVRCVLCSLCKY